VSKAWKWSNKS